MPVTTFQDLAFATRNRAWDGDAARKRIAKWAEVKHGPDKEDVDWRKYRKAFLWYDAEAPEEFGSYKLPIADVVDGDLVAVLSGVRAAANVLEGGRGGADIPSADVPKARRHLDRYYAKARRVFEDDSIVAPWDKDDRDMGGSDFSESQNSHKREGAKVDEERTGTAGTPCYVEVPAYELEVSEARSSGSGEHRADGESGDSKSDTVTFSGYAMRWGEEATIGFLFFRFVEKFHKGAFKKTIKERGPKGNRQIKFLRGHNPRAAIAAKLTDLREDETGLYFEAETIDTSVGRDLAEELRSDVIDTVSIGFSVVREELDQDEDPPVRTVLEARLSEISAVNWPAFAGATIDSTRGFDLIGALSEEGLTELASFAESLEREADTAIREGKVLSEANLKRLREARDRIQQVIDQAQPGEPDEENSRGLEGSEEGDEGLESSDEHEDSLGDLEMDLAVRERMLQL